MEITPEPRERASGLGPRHTLVGCLDRYTYAEKVRREPARVRDLDGVRFPSFKSRKRHKVPREEDIPALQEQSREASAIVSLPGSDSDTHLSRNWKLYLDSRTPIDADKGITTVRAVRVREYKVAVDIVQR